MAWRYLHGVSSGQFLAKFAAKVLDIHVALAVGESGLGFNSEKKPGNSVKKGARKSPYLQAHYGNHAIIWGCEESRIVGRGLTS